jgi:hypothetical protein
MVCLVKYKITKMKKLIILLLILISFSAKSQDSLWITSLQLKAGTIKLLASRALVSGDTSILKVFYKWRAEFISSPPANDNANVTIDSAKTVVVFWMYQNLLNLPAGLSDVSDFVADFRTSITSKRNTNSYLDALCDGIELLYVNQLADYKASGLAFLRSQ